MLISKTMADFGFLRVCAASPRVFVANPKANLEQMLEFTTQAVDKQASIVAFPELSLTGCSCGDLFNHSKLTNDAEQACREYLQKTKDQNIISIFGCPIKANRTLYNCAVVTQSGNILAILAGKPINSNFYAADKRDSLSFAGQQDLYFSSTLCLDIGGKRVAIIIDPEYRSVPFADLIINLSHRQYAMGELKQHACDLSSITSLNSCAYMDCVSGYGESTQDFVWLSDSAIYEKGTLLTKSEPFSAKSQLITADVDCELTSKEAKGSFDEKSFKYDIETSTKTDFSKILYRKIDPSPFVPQNIDFEELIEAQVAALCTRFEHIRCRKAVIGVSGGLDSTLALISTALAFDKMGLSRDGIIGITMPGFGTSSRTKDNSEALMRLLGVQSRCIPIANAVRGHFDDIGHAQDVCDTSYENCQARERTQILMDVAGMEGGIVVGTGDLSEIALGWCTYNGDHMSMYGVNSGLPKTLIRALVEWTAHNKFGSELAEVLMDIVNTPISPELVPTGADGQITQSTENILGPYELHDFFLYNFVKCGFSPEKIAFLAEKAFEGVYDIELIRSCLDRFLKRFFTQQFKRSCSPDGPKLCAVSLSPRGGWVMPSDMEDVWNFRAK